MGKGDKKTRRGKITNGSYGNKRPRKLKPEYKVVEKPPKKEEPKAETKKPAAKKAAPKKTSAKKAAEEKTEEKKD